MSKSDTSTPGSFEPNFVVGIRKLKKLCHLQLQNKYMFISGKTRYLQICSFNYWDFASHQFVGLFGIACVIMNYSSFVIDVVIWAWSMDSRPGFTSDRRGHILCMCTSAPSIGMSKMRYL